MDFPLSSYAWTHTKGAGKAKGRPAVIQASDDLYVGNVLYSNIPILLIIWIVLHRPRSKVK